MKQLPFIFSDSWNHRIQRHLSFWIFWGIFQGFLYSFMALNSSQGYLNRLPLSILESFIFMFAHMFLAYSLIYFVIPRFLLRQKYWTTAAWTITLFFLTACLSTIINIMVIDPLRSAALGDVYTKSIYRNASLNLHLSLLAGLRGGLTIGGIAAAIKLMKHWYLKEQRNLQLQKENTESQLQLLKAQVHPHFLFNTLNNIYAQTQTTSPVASKMVSRLSDLLRFVLYEANQPLVPLQQELKLIRDYISLEKVRYGNKLELDTRFPEQTNGLFIAPLLLLPFVENSFKHGASHMLDQPWISLQIDLDGNRLCMKLVNGKPAGQPMAGDRQPGIGIENARKRLELLYADRYDLVITNEEDVFIVNLRILLEQQMATEIISKEIPSPAHA